MKRWDKESKEFLEQLGGHSVNPIVMNKRPDRETDYRRYYSADGPRVKGVPGDPAVVISARIRSSQKNAIRAISIKKKILLSDLIEEALEDLLKKYAATP